MKNYFLIICLLLPFAAFSQNSDSTKPAKACKLQFGVLFAPEYSYRSINSDNNTFDQQIASFRNSTETYKISYTTGLDCIYHICNKWALSAGIAYSDKGYKTKADALIFGDMIDATRGYVYSQGKETVSFNYHYNYIDVPIKAIYYITTTKLSLFVSAGISVNTHINDYNSVSITDSTVHTSIYTDKANYGFSRINLQAIAGFGASYAICNHLSVMLAPEAAYSITSIIQAPIKEYLYSFGVNVGVYWKL